eukprot:6277902-Amphidinium_carterae.1
MEREVLTEDKDTRADNDYSHWAPSNSYVKLQFCRLGQNLAFNVILMHLLLEFLSNQQRCNMQA